MLEDVDLGRGHRAHFVYKPHGLDDSVIPFGLIETHGRCRMFIPWATGDPSLHEVLWNLVSLRPLTVEQPMACPRCGTTGLIIDDRWTDQ